MQEYAQKPEQSSSENNSRSSGQPPISEILQAYKNGTLQRMSVDEEELLQAKTRDKSSERETLQLYTEYTHRDKSRYNSFIQGMFDTPQRKGVGNEEPLQGKFYSSSAASESTVQRQVKPNNTGLPDNLKSGIENLSGYSMDDVKVHYNSDKPAQLSALAYAQGTDIHVAPGQEKHLPHEAWHVVQQKQGRVQPTMQMQGVGVNDNEGLEREADVMGEQANRHVIQPENSLALRNEMKVDPRMVQMKERCATVVWAVTHEVIPDANDSLFGEDSNPFEKEGIELYEGNEIVVDDEIIFQSRRGANQEIKERRDSDRGGHLTNKWLNLKRANGKDLSGDGYIREETIRINKGKEGEHNEITTRLVEIETAKKAADSIHHDWSKSREKRRMSVGAWDVWEAERIKREKETSPSWDQIEEGFDVSSQLSSSPPEEYENYATQVEDEEEEVEEQNSNQAIFTAYSGVTPIGIIVIEKRSATNFPLFKEDENKGWYLRWLVGHPTLKGAGGKLLEAALKYVTDSSGTGVWVESSPSAMGWYHSKGFEPLQEDMQNNYTWGYQEGWDSILMLLTIK